MSVYISQKSGLVFRVVEMLCSLSRQIDTFVFNLARLKIIGGCA